MKDELRKTIDDAPFDVKKCEEVTYAIINLFHENKFTPSEVMFTISLLHNFENFRMINKIIEGNKNGF